MSAAELAGRGIAGAVRRAGAFLVEPAQVRPLPVAAPTPVVAVIGLAPGVGVTTIARALGRHLAVASGDAAIVWHPASVTGHARPGRGGRLLRERPGAPVDAAGALGPIALVAGGELDAVRNWSRGVPLVLDVPAGELCHLAASAADVVLTVAGPGTLPSLAAAVRVSLSRAAHEPGLVVNGVDPHAESEQLGDHGFRVPRSPLAARLARAGAATAGPFGAAVADLAETLALAVA